MAGAPTSREAIAAAAKRRKMRPNPPGPRANLTAEDWAKMAAVAVKHAPGGIIGARPKK